MEMICTVVRRLERIFVKALFYELNVSDYAGSFVRILQFGEKGGIARTPTPMRISLVRSFLHDS